jgi:hypothetical protein
MDITQCCCTTFHRTLGVHENPSGNYQTEYKYLVSKGQKMAHLISAQLIARSVEWIAYQNIYLPSMSCSLPGTSFNRRELANIQRSPIRVFLSAMTLKKAAKRPPHYYYTSGNTAASVK